MPIPEDHRQLWELIHETRFAMLCHRHADGSLHSHPLTTLNKSLEADASLYFFVSRKTELGRRLAQDGNVNLAYANPDQDTWVSVTGTARLSDDMAKKRELFTPLAKAWFPGGPEDADMELVQVRIDHAEFWNVKESKLVQLFKMAQAALTGTPRQLGEHKALSLR